MPFNKRVLEKYLEEHKSSYNGKYKYMSGYRSGEHEYKCHYYMLDQNFRRIDIFVDLTYTEKVEARFSENLNEQEKQHIINDALQHVIHNESYPRLLHYSLYESYVNATMPFDVHMSPIDYINVLEYMKYHHGINPETIDNFYKLFIPALQSLRERRRYDAYLETMILLFQNILYEYEWDSATTKYLDTEYQFHLYYIREIISKVCDNLTDFFESAKQRLLEVIEILCRNERFSFAIMTDFGALTLSNVHVMNAIIAYLRDKLVLYDKNDDRNPNVNLVFSYLYYIYINDYENYYRTIKCIFRRIMNNMLSIANSDLDLALGNSILQSDGYNVLIDLFNTDYNTFIFTCFPISSFPKELKPKIRDDLVAAIRFFAGRMENDKYRQSSFEQILNINRLLLDNFGDWYR